MSTTATTTYNFYSATYNGDRFSVMLPTDGDDTQCCGVTANKSMDNYRCSFKAGFYHLLPVEGRNKYTTDRGSMGERELGFCKKHDPQAKADKQAAEEQAWRNEQDAHRQAIADRHAAAVAQAARINESAGANLAYVAEGATTVRIDADKIEAFLEVRLGK